jgi:hypothetical protein
MTIYPPFNSMVFCSSEFFNKSGKNYLTIHGVFFSFLSLAAADQFVAEINTLENGGGIFFIQCYDTIF